MPAPVTIAQERAILAAFEAKRETDVEIAARLSLSKSAISKRRGWGIASLAARIRHREEYNAPSQSR